MNKKLTALNGLGPKSTYMLKAIGIYSKTDLVNEGAIPVYLKLKRQYRNVSLNFLYSMIGALEDKHWREIAATRREELLLQIEGHKALESMPASKHHADTRQGAGHENKLCSD